MIKIAYKIPVPYIKMEISEEIGTKKNYEREKFKKVVGNEWDPAMWYKV